MNKIAVILKEVRTNAEIALLRLESIANKEHIFTMVMLNLDDKLICGMQCNVLFKESEVMLCDKNYTKISARNRFNSIIENIESDELFARVSLKFENTLITSLITKIAADDLGLKIGDEVAWFVKSSEVMLEK